MTEIEIRIAIAENVGWKIHPKDKWIVIPPNSPNSVQPLNTIPDYLNDLNAIYDAEKYLGLHDRNNLELRVKWVGILRELVAPFCPLNKVGTSVVSDLDILTADSRIKAMALVKLTQKKKRK